MCILEERESVVEVVGIGLVSVHEMRESLRSLKRADHEHGISSDDGGERAAKSAGRGNALVDSS